MYKDREEFIAALGVAEMPALFGARFAETMAEYEKNSVFYLEDAFLADLQSTYHLFHQKYDYVKLAAKRVRKNAFLAQYYLQLYHMQRDNDHSGEIYLKKFPYGDGENPADYEMAAFFSQLAFAKDIAAHHLAHGVPEDIVLDTLNDLYEEPILVCNDCLGRDGAHPRCFGWNQIYMNYRILRVGVLNFELRDHFTSAVTVLKNGKNECVILANDRDVAPSGQIAGSAGCEETLFHAAITETEDYFEGYAADPVNAVYASTPVRLDKKEWRVVLQRENGILNVHIPSHVALTKENVDASYARAWAVLPKCYPAYGAGVFTCFSWLLDPQLKQFLKPTSNLVAFQNKYHRFAMKSGGTDVYSFLFKKPVEKNEDLCEDTSLQRAVKAHYLSGKYIYAQGGFFFPEEI